jgi:hypothetical protein
MSTSTFKIHFINPLFPCKLLYRSVCQKTGMRCVLQKTLPLWKRALINILIKYVIFKRGLHPFLHILLSFSGFYLLSRFFLSLTSGLSFIFLFVLYFYAILYTEDSLIPSVNSGSRCHGVKAKIDSILVFINRSATSESEDS